jgi:hypothetical protein
MQVLDQDMESAAARPEGLKKGFLRRGRARKAQGEQTVIKSTPTPTKMKESNNTVKKRGLRRGEREVKWGVDTQTPSQTRCSLKAVRQSPTGTKACSKAKFNQGSSEEAFGKV